MSKGKIVLKVDGMSCDACVRSVTRKLSRVPGVASAAVTLKPGRAVVEVDDGQAGAAQLIHAVQQIGYQAAEA